MTEAEITDTFSLFYTGNPGLESFINERSDRTILSRLAALSDSPMSKVQFNQLLLLAHEAGVSDDFFSYYWLSAPQHVYDVKAVEGFDASYVRATKIESIAHLRWGLYRIFVDGLMFNGNIRSFFRSFCDKKASEIHSFFAAHRYDTDAVRLRGPALPLVPISKDNRYLISEMACKSYGDTPEEASDLKRVLLEAYEIHQSKVGGAVKIRDLLDGTYVQQNYKSEQQQWLLSADDMLDQEIKTREELEQNYAAVARAFTDARHSALENTKLYLSMVNDLDVYVATSMRTRDDFRKMAEDCETIFKDHRLKTLHLRYFDPTMSAADGHQDKGLIECLMVKCAKVLVYSAGKKESYGKDSEAAMALSLGKPVIFFCDEEVRSRFYRDVHPLSRLIHFDSGVAVGAMVTDSITIVSELLNRLFENEMEYVLEQPKAGYLQLKEKLTGAIVRLQSSNRMLTEAFWNYYKSANARPTRLV